MVIYVAVAWLEKPYWMVDWVLLERCKEKKEVYDPKVLLTNRSFCIWNCSNCNL